MIKESLKVYFKMFYYDMLNLKVWQMLRLEV